MSLIEDFTVERPAPGAANLPPGPRLPTALQTVLFLAAPTWAGPRWHRRFGDVYSVHIAPGGRGVVLANPDHIREVFAGQPDVFHAGEGNAILGPVMGEHSVLLLDEDAHLQARKRVMAAFHGETLGGWGERIEQITAEQLRRWPAGRAFSVHQRMNDISLEVILQIVFGVSDERRLDELRPLLNRLVKVGPMVFLGWLYPGLQRVGPWRRFALLKEATDALIYAEIADRRTADDLGSRTDVLSKLLVAAPEQSDEELRDHLVTLLLAGHETTASTLAWALHDLARLPEVLTRVQRAADADEDAYLDATVKEAMRRRPVIRNVARRLAAPARVAGYDLPEGVIVLPSILLVHRTSRLWPSPGEFRPERFLDGNPPPATWIPFGGGIRRCLGAGLATVEARAVLKTVLRSVDISPVGRPEWPRTRNITTVPARGARLLISRR
ncbi:MAG: cytochrome P450 [Jatrophihabitantaceae bacterium]